MNDDYNSYVPDVLLQPVVTATVFQILSLPGANLPGFLLSAARSLFQQIVYAHENFFDADHFAEIKSVLEKENILVESLLSKSRHNGMKESVEKFIDLVGSLQVIAG